MHKYVMLGARVPNVELGRLHRGNVETVAARDLLDRRRSIILGVPGAFTPGCTHKYVPAFIRNAGRLKASGYDQLICIVPNDPFVVQTWADMIDPEGKLRFYSDGIWILRRRWGWPAIIARSFWVNGASNI